MIGAETVDIATYGERDASNEQAARDEDAGRLSRPHSQLASSSLIELTRIGNSVVRQS